MRRLSENEWDAIFVYLLFLIKVVLASLMFMLMGFGVAFLIAQAACECPVF